MNRTETFATEIPLRISCMRGCEHEGPAWCIECFVHCKTFVRKPPSSCVWVINHQSFHYPETKNITHKTAIIHYPERKKGKNMTFVLHLHHKCLSSGHLLRHLRVDLHRFELLVSLWVSLRFSRGHLTSAAPGTWGLLGDSAVKHPHLPWLNPPIAGDQQTLWVVIHILIRSTWSFANLVYRKMDGFAKSTKSYNSRIMNNKKAT